MAHFSVAFGIWQPRHLSALQLAMTLISFNDQALFKKHSIPTALAVAYAITETGTFSIVLYEKDLHDLFLDAALDSTNQGGLDFDFPITSFPDRGECCPETQWIQEILDMAK